MSVLELFSLKGRIALVTGGAGEYGRQISTAVAEAGARTYIASRNLEALRKEAARHLKQDREVTPLQFDQADQESILALKDEILKRDGRIDILINNAVSKSMEGAYHVAAAGFARSMDVNATGLFMITRAFGDVMATQGSGTIINIGSIQGMIGPDSTIFKGTNNNPWYPDYFFHKGGMINFTRFIAGYYGTKGVRCNCVSPGGFRSEQTPEIFARQYSERTFLGRMANQSDLMGIIVLLASDASLYISGANIPVDGGYTAK